MKKIIMRTQHHCPPFHLHKMKPQIEGKHLGTYCNHTMISVAQSLVPTQNQTMNMNMIKKKFRHLQMCDHHTTMMI
jgi:hypothetical protein